MTAENPEQGDGGPDLRARYLPVSRKELRRRREAELAAMKDGGPAPSLDATDDVADEAADETDDEAEAAVEHLAPAAPVSVSAVIDQETQSANTPVVSPDRSEDILPDGSDGSTDVQGEEKSPEVTSDAVADVSDPAVEATDVNLAPVSPEDESDPEELDDLQDDDEAEPGGEDGIAADSDEAGSAGEGPEAEDVASDEAASDDAAEERDDQGENLAEVEDPVQETQSPESDELVAESEDVQTGLDDAAEDDAEDDGLGEELEDDDYDDDVSADDSAPIPASRRARRLLRETGSLDPLTDERLQEIDQLTSEIAAQPVQDPHRVDPEVLKRQQALAAKAMQVNQERRRREMEEAARDKVRRRRERPESEVITRKALRAYASSDDQEYTDVATGEIDPIDARGAHGLELDDMVEHTSRQASRQALLLWLVIILAVLLLIAVGVVLFTIR
ncbi:hypothetical protein [Nesterenkonia xinjiangensis]|uniref:Uncharacterized protein n=1 Tax=Nesterenkonia xinjiangensis TaxID=225327 RepID=A0A7Z0KA89_9MICC|nr:hypothetical protein [Nesterenkonia xinjiangensis]NYJ79534.1 hypothetical protein [Nesterenkonia xinjiangensis]